DWLTLRENVALAARDPGMVESSLAKVGLSELSARYPPEVGPGLRKRASIARALALSPRYLLLDEPTTGLDPAAAAQVNEVLAELKNGGLGALVVSHDYRSLR